MKTTIKTIAELAGVSIATVSLVLNKKDGRISEKTRRKVLDIAAEIDYRPNVIARSLVTDRTNTIGLLIPDVANPFFSEIASCIETNLSRERYNLILCNSNNDKEKEKAYLTELLSRNIDGLIISSVNIEDVRQASRNYGRQIPFLIFDRLSDLADFYTVSIADSDGGVLAAAELLANNHTRIACLCGSTQYRNIKARVDGFCAELAAGGIALAPELIIESELNIQSGYEAAKRLIPRIAEHRVTAVFCANDLIAFGAYKAFKEFGIKIPDDVSVIGFDNIEYASYLTPPLTTVGQPVAQIGAKAVEMILNIISGRPVDRKNYVFPVELHRRDSIRKLPR